MCGIAPDIVQNAVQPGTAVGVGSKRVKIFPRAQVSLLDEVLRPFFSRELTSEAINTGEMRYSDLFKSRPFSRQSIPRYTFLVLILTITVLGAKFIPDGLVVTRWLWVESFRKLDSRRCRCRSRNERSAG